ncbi:CLUMA_CG011393, isoform A [Clunio marinus]|uniref:CLUMA_CG011393, isoform A n=1 Tax=Clunio marinus TaxID=568069 RepID=A0A1J1ICR1_9DIPT|nr:CLUMA_CG011393, isoform A [Clunio marinus]
MKLLHILPKTCFVKVIVYSYLLLKQDGILRPQQHKFMPLKHILLPFSSPMVDFQVKASCEKYQTASLKFMHV